PAGFPQHERCTLNIGTAHKGQNLLYDKYSHRPERGSRVNDLRLEQLRGLPLRPCLDEQLVSTLCSHLGQIYSHQDGWPRSSVSISQMIWEPKGIRELQLIQLAESHIPELERHVAWSDALTERDGDRNDHAVRIIEQ